MSTLVKTIQTTHNITLEQLNELLTTQDSLLLQDLMTTAQNVSQRVFGNKIFIRGLIEVSSYCKNDCYYCGLRRSHPTAVRYRLTPKEILGCCESGYELGFRTFVLQGGEDPWFTDDRLVDILSSIHNKFPDCAITLSLGERTKESYQRLYQAGANRYLLRHETASPQHYSQMHPDFMSWQNRIDCLKNLKEIGYQVGCGFMVGAPYQTVETLYQDLQFIIQFQPHMVGIGPFVPTANTPFANQPQGSVQTTLRLLSIIRLLHPQVLLPSTTALGTLHPEGRQLGILAGANVVMPNLSPLQHRKHYSIYDNKLSSGAESAQSLKDLQQLIHSIGYEIVVDRGDSPIILNQ